jgi:hypothetical protein
MKNAIAVLLCLVSPVVVCAQAPGQPPVPASPTGCPEGPSCISSSGGPHGLHWTRCCFPRNGCPDDYCPNPYPRPCWPPYSPFCQCVPAGNCGQSGCSGRDKDRLTWWFLPTPRALREAIWCQP